MIENGCVVFHTNQAAADFLRILFRTYATMDDLRLAHKFGISVIAPGVHDDDAGKTVFDYRVVFSAAPMWKNE